jgi:DNA repair photolyase
VNKDHAFHLFAVEIIEHKNEIIRDGGLLMSFVTDPMCEQNRPLFWGYIAFAAARGIPVTILTKSVNIWNSFRYKCIAGNPHYPNYDIDMKDRKRLTAFGWTLTGHDELEPNAAPNSERLRYMKMASDKGMMTWASIEPVIDFPSSLDMIYQALNAGCQHFKIGLLTNNTRVVRKDFAFDEHHFDAYKVNDCLHFVEDVMRMTDGKATVYWKQSVRDLLGTVYTTAAVDELLNFPHFVGKDWSMFNKED